MKGVPSSLSPPMPNPRRNGIVRRNKKETWKKAENAFQAWYHCFHHLHQLHPFHLLHSKEKINCGFRLDSNIQIPLNFAFLNKTSSASWILVLPKVSCNWGGIFIGFLCILHLLHLSYIAVSASHANRAIPQMIVCLGIRALVDSRQQRDQGLLYSCPEGLLNGPTPDL